MSKIVVSKFGLLLFAVVVAAFIASCSSAPVNKQPIVVNVYKADRMTTQGLKRLVNSGTVSGATRVMSDTLLKSSLPCRTMAYSIPDGKRVATYIADALKSELVLSGKLDEGSAKVDIVVNRLESDTKRTGSGSWDLDFTYKVGKKTINVKTSSDFPIATEARNVCESTADTLEGAIRANFIKFFAQL